MLIRTTIAALLLAAACFAQDTKPPEQSNSYKLNFVVREVSAGKTVNSRNYETILRTGRNFGNVAQIRAGDRVPVTSKDGGANYIDVGVSIDIGNVVEVGDTLRLQVNADLSKAERDPTLPNPVIRQTRWSSNVILPLRKQTLLFSSDSVDSKTQTQLDVTATPLP